MRLCITIAMLEIRNRKTLQSKVNICKSDVKIGDYADSLSRVLRSVQNGEGRGGGEGARLKARVQYSDMVIWLGLLLVFKLYKIQYLIAIHGKHKYIFIDNNY